MKYNHTKPIIDFVSALILLFILSPLLFSIIILLYFTNNGKVFFLQIRSGKNGRPFYIIKFKTMKDIYDANGVLIADEFRITKIGQFLRSTSLDEISQLLNVIKGDMSLVGPRPLLHKYVSLYSQRQFKRLSVKPGITGFAQVMGRNHLSWEEKFDLDLQYIENKSFLLDIKILIKTALVVFTKKGIHSENHVSMEEFKG